MEFPVIFRVPGAARFFLIGLTHTTVVSLLGFARLELRPRVANPFYPPMLIRASNGLHIVIELGVEYVLLNSGGGFASDSLTRFAREVMPAFADGRKMRVVG